MSRISHAYQASNSHPHLKKQTQNIKLNICQCVQGSKAVLGHMRPRYRKKFEKAYIKAKSKGIVQANAKTG